MALAYVEYYTYEDYRHRDRNWELIRGIAYAMSPSLMKSHQALSTKYPLKCFVQQHNCAEMKGVGTLRDTIVHEYSEEELQDVFDEVKFKNETVVRPDVFIKYGELDDITITPEIMFEVIGKGSIKGDELLECNLYRQEGVRFYGLVYPEEKRAEIYKLGRFL